MKLHHFLGASAIALGLAACAEPARQPVAVVAPAPAPAPAPPPSMTDVIGSRQPDTSILTSRNFRLIRTRGAIQYWWRDSDELCVRAVASRGSYREIQRGQTAECSPPR